MAFGEYAWQRHLIALVRVSHDLGITCTTAHVLLFRNSWCMHHGGVEVEAEQTFHPQLLWQSGFNHLVCVQTFSEGRQNVCVSKVGDRLRH